MIYFSELSGKKVSLHEGREIGTLEDLIFVAKEIPLITKILVKTKSNQRLIIPSTYLLKINSHITVKQDYETSQLEDNELHILRNLLDKQIIDLKGNKIVRVNDVAIQDKGSFYIAGVDIGILGVLRWFKFEKLLFKISTYFKFHISSQFLSWADIQPLELAHGKVQLKKEEEKLQRIRPEDLADYLEQTNISNIKKVLNLMDEKQAVDVFSSFDTSYQTELIKQYPADKAARFISLMDPDDAVDVLLTLSPKMKSQVLERFSEEKKNETNRLLSMANNPIGNLITSQVVSVRPDETVKQVMQKIKKETADFTALVDVYVMNSHNQLIGVVNLHELLLQDSDVPIYKFMIQNVVVAHLTSPIDIIFKKFLKYNFAALPVVDNNKHLLGIITLDDIAEYILEKYT